MPPKKEVAGTGIINNSNSFLVQAEEDKVLQAVVIADSFNERFMPITLDKPRVIQLIYFFLTLFPFLFLLLIVVSAAFSKCSDY